MKLLRSVTRRGFTVGTAGWFTITSPNRWFAASRLPRASRYLSEEFQTIESPKVSGHVFSKPANSEAATPPRIMALSADERHPAWQLLILSIAFAITLAMLWWIARAR